MTALTTRGALAAEWIKLRSLRSTYLTVPIAAAVALLVGLVDYHNAAGGWVGWTADQRADFDPVSYGFSGGFYFAILAIGVHGTLAASSEYTTGQIRTTLAAVPRRGQVLAAKALVVGAPALALGEALAFTTFLLGQRELSSRHLGVGLGDPGVARAVIGVGAFLGVLAMVGLALGFIIRRTAGAVAALFGLLFVSPMILGVFGDTAQKFSLQAAFEGLSTTVTHAARSTRPGADLGLAILVGYLAIALTAAALALTRRDA